jgi:hypothetical protein
MALLSALVGGGPKTEETAEMVPEGLHVDLPEADLSEPAPEPNEPAAQAEADEGEVVVEEAEPEPKEQPAAPEEPDEPEPQKPEPKPEAPAPKKPEPKPEPKPVAKQPRKPAPPAKPAKPAGLAAGAKSAADAKPAKPKPKGTSVIARIEVVSHVPDPSSVPYTECVTFIKYKVESVESGEYDGEELLGVHWGMKDSKLQPAAKLSVGQRQKLTIKAIFGSRLPVTYHIRDRIVWATGRRLKTCGYDGERQRQSRSGGRSYHIPDRIVWATRS